MKQVVSVKLPTVGQGGAGGTEKGRVGKPTSEMVALSDDGAPPLRPEPGAKSAGHEQATTEASPLETSTGSAKGTHPAAEHQPDEAEGTRENSAKAAESSEPKPAVAEASSSASPGRKKVKGTKELKPTTKTKDAKDGKDTSRSSPRAPHSSRPPRRASAPTKRTPRSASEPPQTAFSDGAARTPRSLGDPRLPKLLLDIESHFRRVERKLPLDASGWLRETAQLELFQEELQWILQQHPAEEGSEAARP